MAGCVKMMGTVHAYARALSGKQGRISCDPSRSRGKAPVLNPMSEARTLQSRVGTSLAIPCWIRERAIVRYTIFACKGEVLRERILPARQGASFAHLSSKQELRLLRDETYRIRSQCSGEPLNNNKGWVWFLGV